MVVPELDEQLRGTRPGAILEFTATLPERFGERAGEDATFRVIVKDAKQKVLPELTDEWVDEASEFDTVDELRADIRKRLEMMQKLQAQMAVRDKVLEAAADLVPVEAPPRRSSTSETRRRVEDLAHRLSHQKARRSSSTSQATGQEPAGVRRRGARAARRGPCSPTSRCARSSRRKRSRPSDDEVDAEIAAPRRARSSRSPKRCGATSNGGARWRRYALMSPGGRHSSSSSNTRPWSTRRATRSISRSQTRTADRDDDATDDREHDESAAEARRVTENESTKGSEA